MLEIDLIVEDPRWQEAGDLDHLCRAAFDAADAVVPAEGTVSVLLGDDEILRGLNAQFRDKDSPTDVLSFPAPEMDRPLLGDIAVAYGVAARDAAAQAKSLANHLTHLLIHGYLHVMGHDHETDADAEKMEALEIKALASLRIANPYFAD